MTKLEFMKELESLLLDIPLEEREEALKYYNCYFEDAGEDQEAEIIKELGSPSKVAIIIKADLSSNEADRETRGYFTENGYHDTVYQDDKFEIVGATKKETGNNGQAANANQADSTQNSYQQGSNYNQGPNINQGPNFNQGPNYNQGPNPNQGNTQSANNAQQTNKNSNTGLYLLIGICTFPIWFPLLMAAFGIAIGLVATIFGLIFGFGIAGVSMIVAGIVMFCFGLAQISVPFIGIALIGSGLLVFGIGMMMTLACILLCKKVLPALVRGFVDLCRLPFKNRSVMA